MKQSYTAAIVGYGGMGAWHNSLMKSSGVATVSGIYDISPERRAAARKDGLVVFDTPEQIAGAADVVILSVPNELHLPYTEFFAGRGMNVISEKPASLNVADFRKMRSACEKNGVFLLVHQNRRWDRDYLTVKEIARQDLIGNVYEIESAVTGSHGIPGDWRKEKARGGGMMLDWGVHLIDQLLLFDTSPIIDIECDFSFVAGFEVDDGFRLRLSFESGLKATVIVETNTFIPRPRWIVKGIDGTAVIENWNIEGKIVRVKEREDKFLKGIDAGNGFTKTMADRSAVTVEELQLPVARLEPHPFCTEVLNVLNGKPQTIKNDEVERVLKVMEQAFKGRAQVRL